MDPFERLHRAHAQHRLLLLLESPLARPRLRYFAEHSEQQPDTQTIKKTVQYLADLMQTFGVRMRDDRTESQLVFDRSYKRTDHRMLLGNISQRPAINLAQPEEETAEVRITAQVAEVLCGHKGSVVLSIDKSTVINRVATHIVVGESIHDCSTPTRVEE
jgi:hypothetical protein